MVRVVHPTAFLSPSTQGGDGLFLGPLAVVHSNCRLGKNVSIYSGSTIDHDNSIGDHVFIGPGVHTAGQVRIGPCAYVGPGVVVGSGRIIGKNSILGAGAVVIEDIPDDVVAFGVPARVKQSIDEWKNRK
jgi:acetyltransferase EpsM